jgi:hypothetical protein
MSCEDFIISAWLGPCEKRLQVWRATLDLMFSKSQIYLRKFEIYYLKLLLKYSLLMDSLEYSIFF